jgi:hypothetical protein
MSKNETNTAAATVAANAVAAAATEAANAVAHPAPEMTKEELQAKVAAMEAIIGAKPVAVQTKEEKSFLTKCKEMFVAAKNWTIALISEYPAIAAIIGVFTCIMIGGYAGYKTGKNATNIEAAFARANFTPMA